MISSFQSFKFLHTEVNRVDLFGVNLGMGVLKGVNLAHPSFVSALLNLCFNPINVHVISPNCFLIGTFLVIAIVILDYNFLEGWQQFVRALAIN